MKRLLLRLGGRAVKAAWEERKVDILLDREFQLKDGSPDLRPSVYEIPADAEPERKAQAIQVQAEHGASFLGNPPRRIVDVDVEGLVDPGRVEPTPGETLFKFANDSHREIRLASVDELRRLVEGVLADWPCRLVGVTRAEVLGYVAVQLEAKDPEWLCATDEGMPAHGWLKHCDAYRSDQE